MRRLSTAINYNLEQIGSKFRIKKRYDKWIMSCEEVGFISFEQSQLETVKSVLEILYYEKRYNQD